MPIKIDEMLIVLGVDAKEARKASEEVDKLKQTVQSVGPAADTSLLKAAAHTEKLADRVRQLGARGYFAQANAAARELLDTFRKAEPASESFFKGALKANLLTEAIKGATVAVGALLVDIVKLPVDAFNWVEQGAKGLDALAKQSRSLGIPVEQLQRLNFAGSQAGIGLDQLNDAVRTLNKNVESNLIGTTGESTKGFQLLGLEVKKLKNLDTVERLKVISDALKLLKTDTERATASARIFGEFGGFKIQSLLGAGSEEIQKALDQAQVATAAQVKAGEDLTNEFGVLRNQLGGFRISILSAAVPAVRRIVDETNKWLETNRAFINTRLHETVSAIGGAVQSLLPHALEAANAAALWVRENETFIRQEIPAKLREMARDAGDVASALGGLVSVGRTIASVFRGVNLIVGGGLTTQLKKLEELRKAQEAFDKRLEKSEAQRLKEQSRQGVVGNVIGLPTRAPTKEQVEAAKLERDRLQVLKDSTLRAKQEANRAKLEAGKKKKTRPAKKQVRSGVTADEVIESLLFGENPQEEIKNLAANTPSTKDVKPTVAIDYFSFNVVQHITSSDPLAAGRESAAAIRAEFRKGTARGTAVSNVVR